MNRKIRKRTIYFLLLLTVFFTCLSFVRPLSAEGKNCVLLVNGHGKKSAGKNSIKKMKRLLKQLPDFAGCNISEYTFSLDGKAGKATEKIIEREIKNAFASCSGDHALFYYVGHGANDGGIVLSGKEKKIRGEKKVTADTVFCGETLAASLLKVKCSKMYIVMDSCYSGSLVQKFDEKAEKKKPSGYRYYLFGATMPGKSADYYDNDWFWKRNEAGSALTEALTGLGSPSYILFMEGPLKKYDKNKDGILNFLEAEPYITKEVRNMYADEKKNRKEPQVPRMIFSHPEDDFFPICVLNTPSLSLQEGKKGRLSVTCMGESCSAAQFTWTSANPDIAMFSPLENRVIGVGDGKTTIKTKAYGYTLSCKVTVTGKPIRLTKKSLKLYPKQTADLMVKPSVQQKIIWKSSNKKIAAVDEYGHVTAKKAGTAVITAQAGTRKAACTVTVQALSISLNRKTVTLCPGETAILKAKVRGPEKDVDWISNNPDVAVIVSTGKILALKTGTVTVIAEANGKKAVCTVNVVLDTRTVKDVDPGYRYIALIKSDDSLWMGGANDEGQLGVDTDVSYHGRLIKVMDQVEKVQAGFMTTLILKKDHTLWVCGRYFSGVDSSGNPIYESLYKPKKIAVSVRDMDMTDFEYLILKQDDTLWMRGNRYYGTDGKSHQSLDFRQIMTGVRQAQICSNGFLALKNDNTLWSYGHANDETLGRENAQEPGTCLTENVKQVVSAGNTAIIKADGSLWMCGRNNYTSFGHGSEYDIFRTPEKTADGIQTAVLNSDFTALLQKDGSLRVWGCLVRTALVRYIGTLEWYQNQVIAEQVQKIALGSGTLAILKKDGSLWVFGEVPTVFQNGISLALTEPIQIRI